MFLEKLILEIICLPHLPIDVFGSFLVLLSDIFKHLVVFHELYRKPLVGVRDATVTQFVSVNHKTVFKQKLAKVFVVHCEMAKVDELVALGTENFVIVLRIEFLFVNAVLNFEIAILVFGRWSFIT